MIELQLNIKCLSASTAPVLHNLQSLSFTASFLYLPLSISILCELIRKDMKHLPVEDSTPFGGRGIPFYLSQFVSILGNLYPDRGIKGSFLGMFGKMDLCKKILIQAYTSLILPL